LKLTGSGFSKLPAIFSPAIRAADVFKRAVTARYEDSK